MDRDCLEPALNRSDRCAKHGGAFGFKLQERHWLRWKDVPDSRHLQQKEVEHFMVGYVDALAIKATVWELQDDGVLEQIA
jgi:hypothetical protein